MAAFYTRMTAMSASRIVTPKLVRYSRKEATTTDWNAKNRGLRNLSIRHTLLLSHIRAVLVSAVRSRADIRLAFCKEGPETYDAIEVALPEGYTRVPVAPPSLGSKTPRARCTSSVRPTAGR